MDVNFALSAPYQWARDELSARSRNLVNPGKGPWATQRKPWIRAISAAKVEGSYNLRNQYILFTGTQTSFGSSYESNFFRPKPGITSMEMDFKGTMGSTRSITLNFQCWTKEDLEALEKLYMIPGMSIIVEWGWSVTPSGIDVAPISTFLGNPTPSDNYASIIMKDIIAARERYSGNYDGFVGLVSNFNYTLNEDLGFDCTIEIIGAGEMFLEQSAVNNSAKCKETEPAPGKSKSNFEFQANEYYKKGSEKEEYITKINTEDKTTSLVRQIWELETREADKSTSTIGQGVEGAADSVNSARENWEVYVSWAKFVSMLNFLLGQVYETNANNTAASNRTSKSNGSNSKLALNIIPVSILPKLMSADPRICVFKPHNVDKEKGKTRQEAVELSVLNENQTEIMDGDSMTARAVNATFEFFSDAVDYVKIKGNQIIRSIGESSLFNNVGELFPENSLPALFDVEFAKKQITIFGDTDDDTESKNSTIQGSETNNVGFLNSIFINCAYLRDILQNAEDNLNIEDLLSKVLSDINDCTGNLWNLQFTVPEKYSNKLVIYDANYTAVESRDPANINPYTFSIEQTLPLKVTVESKLVDGFKEMVLYDSSTTDNGTTNTANRGTKLYADQIEDGYKKKSKLIDKCPKTTEGAESSLNEDPEADVDAAYYILHDAVDDESVAGAKSALKQYIKFLEEKPETADIIPKNNNVLLPFNFSLDIDGFSGLIWGNAIMFDYLPSRYKSKVSFQITKLKHSVNPEQWITSIETVMRVSNSKSGGSTAVQQSQPNSKPSFSNPPVNPAGIPESPPTNNSYVTDKVTNSTKK